MAWGGDSDEQAVSATDEATLRAAAIAAVPGGTVVRTETDAGDGEYEAHLTKADGTPVTVKLNGYRRPRVKENRAFSGWA
jgi:hypothetical protein